MNKITRVVLADDHALLRSGLRMLLENESGFEVVGEAENGQMAVKQALTLCPDVVLMDISFPDIDGVEATRQICDANPSIRVIALTMFVEEDYLTQFLKVGGAGYVHKSVADRVLITAIRTVMAGEIFLRPEGVQVIARQQQGTSSIDEISPDALSERELQVLKLIARGYTCREIGEQISLSPRTVETYRERIREKLELERRSELVDYALRHRLLEEKVR